MEGAFPTNCDTLYLGETFTLKMLFTNNDELGFYSIDIHNNFDHYSHNTEVTKCNLGKTKEPVNPYVFIEDYKIAEGLMRTKLRLKLRFPMAIATVVLTKVHITFLLAWLIRKDGQHKRD
jgi:disulfide oxidoreductase YuzD